VGGRWRLGVTLPGSIPPAEVKRLAALVEAAGFESLWVLDVRRDPYLAAAAALDATSRIQVGTNVAVAFARSPTVTATTAWDLARWGDGRFVLGLGSQVGPTLEARFGVVADHPAPRMRDYVGAVRACFEAFSRGHGRYAGEFYTVRRPAFQPGADPMTPPPIYVAAVNPVMTGVAGEVGDGLAAHPMSTPAYLAEVIRPRLEAAAARAGRQRPELLLQLVVAPSRAIAATQMMVYTVPGYRRVLDHHHLGGAVDQVLAATAGGRRAEAKDVIDREFLDVVGVIVGDDLETGLERWRGVADRITLSVPWFGIEEAEQVRLLEELVERAGPLSAAVGAAQ
jgi:probable F420-dependent oxidoreductase